MGWRSWRDQRQTMKVAFPFSLRSVRRYRRAHGIPDLPGLWHTPRRSPTIEQRVADLGIDQVRRGAAVTLRSAAAGVEVGKQGFDVERDAVGFDEALEI